MNAEMLHDALNLLPGDLITATDKLRSRPRKQGVRWLRHAAMAACFVLILGAGLLITPFFFGMGGSSAPSVEDSMMQEAVHHSANGSEAEAPMEQPPAAAGTPAAEGSVDSTACAPEETERAFPWVNAKTQYIQIPLLDSTLCIDKAYPAPRLIRTRQELEDYCEANSQLHNMDNFREGCKIYDDTFFAENDLLLVETEGSYDAVHHEVLSLTEQRDGSWELTIRRQDANMAAADAPIPMCILMDLRKDSVGAEDIIRVIFE